MSLVPAMPPAPVVVLACGNPSRGDDALGPLLLERLQNWLHSVGLADGFELIGDFQLQVEHALDLTGRRLALFIDAGEQTPSPYAFRQVAAAGVVSPGTHALPPAALLAVLRRIGEPPPPAFVLCVRGERFALGEGLSRAARDHADAAFELLTEICRASRVDAWQARVTGDV